MKNAFVPSNLTLDDIVVGQKYNVHKKDDSDLFNHDFVGTVIQHCPTDVIVEDMDGDCFNVNSNQLTPNTDDIMHGNA